MRNIPLVISACLLIVPVSLLAAQPQQSPTAARTSMGNSASTSRVVEGCLAFTGQTYVLAVVSNGPKQYRIMGGNTGPLHSMVGHTVEVTGKPGKSTLLESIALDNPIDATTGVGYDTITADEVQEVVSNCSVPGFERDDKKN